MFYSLLATCFALVFLGVFFDPEDPEYGGENFLRNIRRFSAEYTVLIFFVKFA
jgi:hypothetical protein